MSFIRTLLRSRLTWFFAVLGAVLGAFAALVINGGEEFEYVFRGGCILLDVGEKRGLITRAQRAELAKSEHKNFELFDMSDCKGHW